MRMLTEPARQVSVIAEADVVVLGGGPAGVAAAAAAARAGARTILLERYGFLGGMGSAAGVTVFCGIHMLRAGEVVRVVRGLADEILDRLAALDGLNAVQTAMGRIAVQSYDIAPYKLALDDLLLSSGVAVRFHTLAVGTVMEGARIAAVLIETKSGRGAITARQFVDASGDADLAAWAGVPYEKSGPDGFLAFPTTMFRMGGVDTQRAQAEGKPRLDVLMAEAEASGDFTFTRRHPVMNVQAHAGEWRVNATQITRGGAPVDCTDADDLTYAEVEGRKQAAVFARFLRERVPGFESAWLQDIAPQVGVRETRRVFGRHRYDAPDVLEARDFDDAIGVNAWPVEKHVLGNVEWRFPEGRGYGQIPFGCLVPERVDNLLVAGRCASATGDGQASLRVSGPCFAMGQASGLAAAMAGEGVVGAVSLAALQAALRRDGVFFGD